jgi:putative ABC transport system permease protein
VRTTIRISAAVAVISDKLNQQVFGGGNSVGKTIDIEGKDYRVIGVLNNWNPQPRFYDVVDTGGFSDGDGPDVFLPFQRAIA